MPKLNNIITTQKLNEAPTSSMRSGYSAKRENGFSLIEVLVASAIITILGAGFLGMQYIFSNNQISAWKNYHNVDEANRMVIQIIKELRNIQESETGSYPLVTAGDNEIVFFADEDQDGNIDRIRYTLTGSTLVKGVVVPSGSPLSYVLTDENTQVLTENVRNGSTPLFYYYNTDWPTDNTNNPLSAENRIARTRQIKISIRVNTKEGDRTENDFLIESEANLRTLRQN